MKLIIHGEWNTINSANDDCVINDIREAIARRGYLIGDCLEFTRTGNSGRASVVVFTKGGNSPDKFYEWFETVFTVDGETAL